MAIQTAPGYAKPKALPGATKTKLLPYLEGSLGASLGLPSGTLPKPIGVAPVKMPAAPAAPGLSPMDEYMNQLRNDPLYGTGEKAYNAALEMGQRQLGDSINQLIMQYGYDPRDYAGKAPQSALDLANQYLDPAALAAAKANPNTTANQIAKNFNQALAGVPTNLAAQGLEGSGSNAIIGNRLVDQRGQQDQAALGQLFGGINTANQTWLGNQNDALSAWEQAQADIATRLSQQPGYSASATAPATATVKVSPVTSKVIQKVRKTQPKAPSPWLATHAAPR